MPQESEQHLINLCSLYDWAEGNHSEMEAYVVMFPESYVNINLSKRFCYLEDQKSLLFKKIQESVDGAI